MSLQHKKKQKTVSVRSHIGPQWQYLHLEMYTFSKSWGKASNRLITINPNILNSRFDLSEISTPMMLRYMYNQTSSIRNLKVRVEGLIGDVEGGLGYGAKDFGLEGLDTSDVGRSCCSQETTKAHSFTSSSTATSGGFKMHLHLPMMTFDGLYILRKNNQKGTSYYFKANFLSKPIIDSTSIISFGHSMLIYRQNYLKNYQSLISLYRMLIDILKKKKIKISELRQINFSSVRKEQQQENIYKKKRKKRKGRPMLMVL